MAKVLVVCYSRSGNTEIVAREIARAMDADFDRVEDIASRSGVLGFIGSALEAAMRGLPAIRTHRDPRSYDLVVLATPVWSGTMSSPMRSYLFLHRDALPKIGVLTVMGARGGEEAQRDILGLCGADVAPTCTLTESEIKQARHQPKLTEFIGRLQQQLRVQSQPNAAA